MSLVIAFLHYVRPSITNSAPPSLFVRLALTVSFGSPRDTVFSPPFALPFSLRNFTTIGRAVDLCSPLRKKTCRTLRAYFRQPPPPEQQKQCLMELHTGGVDELAGRPVPAKFHVSDFVAGIDYVAQAPAAYA